MKTKQYLLIVGFGVTLFVGLMKLNTVVDFLTLLVHLLYPVLLGMLLAFILNVPMRGVEKRLRALAGRSAGKYEGAIRGLSLLLSVAAVILVIVLVFTLLLPELIRSVESIIALVKVRLPEWVAWLNSYDIYDVFDIDGSWITEKLAKLDIENLLKKLGDGAGTVISSVADLATATVSAVVNAVFACIIAIYILLSKHDLSRQGKKLLYAHLSAARADTVCRVLNLILDTYAKFFSGQCVEALILGVLIFLSFSVMNLPYASLIAVLTAVCALIPYVGAFVSCTLGAFLTLLADPSHVLLCIVVYLVVQFIENQFIYPHVVGSSVGLSPLWTLVAALIGGNVMGIVGMIFFIPLVAVVQSLLSEDTNRRLKAKKIRIK